MTIARGTLLDEAGGDRVNRGVRLALGLFFLAAGLAKLYALDATTEIVASRSLPFAGALAFVVGAFESLAGLMFLTDTRTRAFARALMPFVILVALVFHTPIGLASGAAHANAISLAVDALVLVGLYVCAQRRKAA